MLYVQSSGVAWGMQCVAERDLDAFGPIGVDMPVRILCVLLCAGEHAESTGNAPRAVGVGDRCNSAQISLS